MTRHPLDPGWRPVLPVESTQPRPEELRHARPAPELDRLALGSMVGSWRLRARRLLQGEGSIPSDVWALLREIADGGAS